MNYNEIPQRGLRARSAFLRKISAAAVLAAWLLAGPILTLPAGDESIPDRSGQPAVQRTDLLDGLGVTRWHAAGVRGAGVKVAVLDSGFRGYRKFLGSSLPETITTRSFRSDGNLEAKDSQHGILCGEVIHTLAPSADLMFANWEPDRPESFLEAVRWAKKEGARVITCSVIMPSWSDGEGHGSVHDALSRILENKKEGGDVVFFASAGNTAKRHWSGAFHDRGDGYHEWEPGKIENTLSRLGNERVSIELFWKRGPDYDLKVVDRDTDETVASSTARQNGHRGCTVARFYPQPDHRYAVEVHRARGSSAGSFHLVALSTGSELEFADYHGSVCFPADGPEVVAVGAVDSTGQRMPYSSCGPILTETKPDLVARVPFPSQWREMPFGGTSAASPQAAALAALWLSRDPSLTSTQVRRQLRSSASCLNKSGPSCETGFGLIRLP
jgi:subtilisin family serine protease